MLNVGDFAFDFDLPTSDGKIIKLSDRLKLHSPILIVFYKFDCPTCQFTFKHLPHILNQLGDEHFLAIAQDAQVETEKFKASYSYQGNIVCDVKPYPVSSKFGITFVPTFFVVEQDLKISNVGEGFDKIIIDNFSKKIALAKSISQFQTFRPAEQVPLLKPG
ncbi:MAG: redoxin domain-containing protein [Oligoflexia bacterium]|nr:redoxin domain-containing protein [Oligoflexia bacterium]